MTQNSNPGQTGMKKIYNLASGRRKWLIVAGSAAALAVFILVLASGKNETPEPVKSLSTFTVRRDDLTITVTESGSIKARKSIDLKSEVEGRATIINIVPEGSYVTQEDVDSNKILVELDSGELKEQLSQRQIDYTTAEASYAQAKEAYDIQVKQNESDIAAAQLKVKFALMDFQKYLGDKLAGRLIEMVNEANDANADIATLINVNSLLNDPNNLGGECSQRLGELHDNIVLAEEQLKRAQNTLDWTIRLREKQYVSETDLQSDRLNVESLEIKLGQAKTDLNLYNAYDFSKQTQKLLSDYYEANRNLERTYAKARSQLAQAQAQLESAKARFELQEERLNKTKIQLAACTIKAPGPGLVVYGSSLEPMQRFRGGSSSGMIAPGEQVFQRQIIITLPDTSEMMAEITVHESAVDSVKPGQMAKIVMDAFPDKTFKGEVIKIAPLPDQQRSWLSPDVKVYTTQVSIEGQHDFLKPGMSARVEILVEHLDEVVIVPVQVVANRAGKKVCFVLNSSTPVEREVKTGLFNDTFVQILEGLEPGEQVLLNPPRITESKAEADKQLADELQKTGQQPRQTQDRPAQGRLETQDPNRTGRRRQGMFPGGGNFDPNQLDDQTRERFRRFREMAERGEMPQFDINQLDEQTRERIKQFREMAERGEMPQFDPNQFDEQTRERFRQFRSRTRENSDGEARRQEP